MKAFIFTLFCLLTLASAQLDMTSDKMGFEDNIAEESSHSDEKVFATKPLLNDGRPFFVARDPNTGSLDFSQKKTAGIPNDIPRETKDELSGFSKSGHDIGSLGNDFFHDKLNLPVKYSSSKFVIPLISGSYANLKYQGNNKNHDSNHKNYTSTLGTTQPPRYYTHIRDHTFTATFKHPTTTAKTPPSTTKVTTIKTPPSTRKHVEESTTFRTAASTKIVENISTTTETPKTTIKYSSTIVQQNQFPSTLKNYVDSSETRKKTTLKIVESSTPRVSPIGETKAPAHPVKFVDEDYDKYSKPTTYRPPLSHETRLSFSTSMPILKPSAFKPVPTEAPRNQSQKIVFETGSKNPSVMSLSDIFNSITKTEHDSIPYDAAESIRQPQIEIKTLPPVSTSTHRTPQQTQNVKQQFVDLPVYQPQYPTHKSPSHIEFPTDEGAFEDYVEFENPADSKYANQYVKYEVHKPVNSNSSPNPNLVAFKQIPSINNVVISPSQNSASFVLGSQQSVGSVGVGSSMGVGTSEFVNTNGPMKVGQVINDAPPVRSNQMQANVRFPSEGSSSFDNAQIVKGTIKMEGTSVDVVQPPQALSQNKPAQPQKPLVFPSNSVSKPTTGNNAVTHGSSMPSGDPSKVIFENVNDIYEKVTDKKLKQESMSNELAGNIAAGELKPPSFNQQSTQYPFIHHQQFANSPPQFVRRPGSGPVQQRPPRPPVYHQQLPNILPQFRPNSKASHGHPQAFQDHGSIRVPTQYSQAPPPFLRHPYPAPKIGLPSMMSPPPPSAMMSSQSVPPNPSNFRHGPQQPTRKLINRPNGPNQYPQESANRRNYRPQSAALTSSHSMNDLTYMKPPPVNAPNFQLKRILTGKPETLQMLHRPQSIPQQQHVSDVELNKSLPPAPSTMLSSVEEEVNGTILEPVVTLQMLQSKKTSGGKLNLPPVPQDITQDLHEESLPSNHKKETNERLAANKPSVYVVYPVQSHSSFENPQALKDEEKDGREPSIISEYQNTPFSVVSHFEQEPLLMKKDKKRYPTFPYHLERPQKTQIEMKSDLQRPTEFNYDGSIYNIGEQPMNMQHANPDAISSKLVRATERPIAIAYTPTEPNRVYTSTSYYRPNNQYSHYYDPYLSSDKFPNPNFGRPIMSEILDDKRLNLDFSQRPPHVAQPQRQPPPPPQREVSSQKEHFDFQAPFQASVSLNPEVTNPYEGWAVVTQATDTNKIDRSDMFGIDDETTKRFDLTDFQPMFESGFKPIYSERRVSLEPEIEAESDEMSAESDESTEAIHSAKLIETSPARAEPEIVYTSPSTTTSFETSNEISKSTSSIESTTQLVEKKEKKKLEIDSLEAFFDSLTRDYDDDNDSESTNKSENESRSL